MLFPKGVVAVQQFCTITEACDLLGCSSEAIQEQIDSGALSVSINDNNILLLLSEVRNLSKKTNSPDSIMQLAEIENDINPDANETYSFDDPLIMPEDELFDLSATEAHRDRIVILGRTRSGKTVFLTRLYEQLWKSKSNFHIKALSGPTHKKFMQGINNLRDGKWPPSTGEYTYSTFEITDEDRKRLLVSLDYAGEQFSLAFTEGSNRSDVQNLVKHVDKACGVLLLLSPDIDHEHDIDASADDTIGMQLAVEHIRNAPGGDKVPIAIVITKGDQFNDIIRQFGGIVKYVNKHYLPLLRVIGHYKAFLVSAVQCRKSQITEDGSYIPNLELPPIHLLEPLRWCLNKLNDSDDQIEWERRRSIYLEKDQQRILDEIAEKKRLYLSLSIIFTIAVLISTVAVVSILTFMLG